MPKIREDVELSLSLDEPDRYKVILHNDDYTTMEFVIEVLVKVFHKSIVESEQIMLTVHKKGKAVCGIYTYDIAQTKVYQVRQLAKENGFPLLATFEQA
ncbi:MAG: ATP-dependent Clp protease adaptor ClpS [Epsilonproteobacteria bacterium]|nr:ATP-dependent Clp protease adaptor ClpS [Campylobacterota bacterium]